MKLFSSCPWTWLEIPSYTEPCSSFRVDFSQNLSLAMIMGSYIHYSPEKSVTLKLIFFQNPIIYSCFCCWCYCYSKINSCHPVLPLSWVLLQWTSMWWRGRKDRKTEWSIHYGERWNWPCPSIAGARWPWWGMGELVLSLEKAVSALTCHWCGYSRKRLIFPWEAGH